MIPYKVVNNTTHLPHKRRQTFAHFSFHRPQNENQIRYQSIKSLSLCLISTLTKGFRLSDIAVIASVSKHHGTPYSQGRFHVQTKEHAEKKGDTGQTYIATSEGNIDISEIKER